MTSRRIVLASAAVLALLGAAGCSHHAAPSTAAGSPGAAQTSGAVPGGDGGSPTAAPGATTPASPGPTGAGCAAGQLRVAQAPGNTAASGLVIIAIEVTNTSNRACTVDGFPSFTLADAGGRALRVAVVHGGSGYPALDSKPTPVPVAPGGHTGFLLEYSNRPDGTAGSCGHAVRVALTRPGGAATGPVDLPTCGDPVKVSPYLPAASLALS